jgi:hypothetical protein
MARVMARAVGDRQRPLRNPLSVPFGRFTLTLSAAASADIVQTIKRRAGTHNARRRQVETLVWRHFYEQYQAALLRGSDASEGPPEGIDQAELGRELRRLPEVGEALDRMWPILTPPQFLHDLFGAPPLIELAGRALLTPDEQARLHRPRRESVETVGWTEADLALLDEARALLGPPRRRTGPGEEDGPRSFGHIVVDEAQDLSPMELRMLGRRSLSGSMTVVGDIAQATGEWAPGSWDEVLAHLPARRGSRVVELTVNYRTPSEIMDLAGRVLAVAAPSLHSPESVRSTGVTPRVVATGHDTSSVAETAARMAREEAAVVSGETAAGGTVAVITPPSLLEAVGQALTEAGVAFGTVAAGALEDTVSVMPIASAKGLEFDSVIVVEPARLVEESPQGLRALYVALTRTTRRLALVHADPLPEPLAG